MANRMGRKYRLVVGQPPKILTAKPTYLEKEIIGSLDPDITVDFRTETTLDAVELTEHRINASVTVSTKSTKSNGSNTTIRLYNLSPDTLAIVARKSNKVILQAGYSTDKELPIIFSGQVFDYATEQEGQDRVTVLKCTDGYTVNDGIRVSESFPPRVTYDTIFRRIIDIYKKNGIALGQYIEDPLIKDRFSYTQLEPPLSAILPLGYSYTGYLHGMLEEVCDAIGYVSYILSNRLFIHPQYYTKTAEVYQLGLDLVKSIQKQNTSKDTTSSQKGPEGIKMETFLDGRLIPDKLIQITEGDFEGMYKILTTSISMDNELGDWVTRITAQQVTN